jgi:C1A family cysteine protease
MDLSNFCSPIENQERLGSCTAHAGVGLVEFFEKKAFGNHVDASRLFLYKVTRNLMKVSGDTGAHMRTTMEAMVLFGVPPEDYYPYNISVYDHEPSAFCYAFAQNFKTISYYRYDPPGTSTTDLLVRIKINLAASLPSMFGFTVFASINQAESSGQIPFPTRGETIRGGHAVMAVGYDDTIKIRNTNPGGDECTGALLIRNSWGKDWGDKGYGWLPYDYVQRGLTGDWWSIIKKEWVDTNNFKL